MNYRTEKRYNIMKRSCFDKRYKKYRSCGKRGITVDFAWMDFRNFYRDMGECPISKNLWRININGNYCKSNCCWSTKKEIRLIRENSL